MPLDCGAEGGGPPGTDAFSVWMFNTLCDGAGPIQFFFSMIGILLGIAATLLVVYVARTAVRRVIAAIRG